MYGLIIGDSGAWILDHSSSSQRNDSAQMQTLILDCWQMYFRACRKRIKLNCVFSRHIFKEKTSKYKRWHNVLWPRPKDHNGRHWKTSAYEYERNGKAKIFACWKLKIIIKSV